MTMNFKPYGLALVAQVVMASYAVAAPSIQNITSSVQGGSDVIRIELNEALAALPPGFVVQSPPRIAVDLPGVANAMGHNMVEINQGNVRTINVAQAGDRTRLVLNLRAASNYKASLQGKVLILTLDNGNAQAAATAAPDRAPADTVRFAEPRNVASLALKDIDFRRGQQSGWGGHQAAGAEPGD